MEMYGGAGEEEEERKERERIRKVCCGENWTDGNHPNKIERKYCKLEKIPTHLLLQNDHSRDHKLKQMPQRPKTRKGHKKKEIRLIDRYPLFHNTSHQISPHSKIHLLRDFKNGLPTQQNLRHSTRRAREQILQRSRQSSAPFFQLPHFPLRHFPPLVGLLTSLATRATCYASVESDGGRGS